MIQSPVEDYLCTVGADESLRFWKLDGGLPSSHDAY